MKITTLGLLALFILSSCCSQVIPKPIQISKATRIRCSPQDFGEECTFLCKKIALPHLPPGTCLFLSGSPDKNKPLLVDNYVEINGGNRRCGMGYRNDPPCGKLPTTDYYVYVGPFDITEDAAKNPGNLTVAFIDAGGVYCCDAVYLRFVCPDKKIARGF